MSTDLQTATYLACVFESTARKPGNAHRLADLPGLTYLELITSASAIAPIMAFAPGQPVGATIQRAVKGTRRVVATNSNLGIILLLAPLAAVAPDRDVHAGSKEILRELTVEDARLAFEAIRIAKAGGMGRVDEADVAQEPTIDLRAAMALAADRDLIARQYANDFADVFSGARAFASTTEALETQIIELYFDFLRQFPDSLIARKRGLSTAKELQRLAMYNDRTAMLEWFAVDPAGRNPGTTADLVAASLFVALRTGIIELPLDRPWAAP